MKKHKVTFTAELDENDDSNYHCKMHLELDGSFGKYELENRMDGIIQHFQNLAEHHLEEAFKKSKKNNSLN